MADWYGKNADAADETFVCCVFDYALVGTATYRRFGAISEWDAEFRQLILSRRPGYSAVSGCSNVLCPTIVDGFTI